MFLKNFFTGSSWISIIDITKSNPGFSLSSIETTSKSFPNLTVKYLEEENSKIDGYLTARLSGNSVVHFKGPKELIGCFVNVRLNEAKGFYYIGELEE